jgi:hypothetical protein
MKPSYDEKKQKKSHGAFDDLFFALITDRTHAGESKPQILPRTGCAVTQYYRMPTAEFQIAAARAETKGSLSARTDGPRSLAGNVLLWCCSYETTRGRRAQIQREPEWKPVAAALKEVPLQGVRSKWISFAAWC